MRQPITITEQGPDRLRLRGGWIEAVGVRMFIDYQIQRGDALGGAYDFDALLAAARSGRRLLVDPADGAVTLEQA